MNLFDLTETKAKKQTVNEGIEIVYEKIDEDYAGMGVGGNNYGGRGGGAGGETSPRNNHSVIGSDGIEIDEAQDAWHSTDEWHGDDTDEWHGGASDRWHGQGDAWHGMDEAAPDTAARLKHNLKKGGFDMDRFEAKIREIEARNRELADEFYARHPELDDRHKTVDEDDGMFGSIGSDAGAAMGAATTAPENNMSPIGSGTVDEGRDDEVGFGVSSERAYRAVMAQFGDYIDHRDNGVMYAPQELWGAIEQTAFDADEVGAEEDSGIDEDQYGGGFGGGSIGPVTDSTSPVGGGGAGVAEGDVVAFKRPVSQPKTNQQPQNYHAALELAGDWFWLEQGPMAHEMGTAKERKMQRLAAQKLVALKKLGYSVDWPLDDDDFYGVDLTYIPTKQTWRIDADNLGESMQGVVEAEFEPHTAKFGKQVLGYGKGRDEPEGHNNIEIQINGRTWKIFPGAGPEGSKAWFEQKQKMREMCKRKSAETGKEWRMYITGRPTTESVAKAKEEDITEDIYESRLYKMKLAGYEIK